MIDTPEAREERFWRDEYVRAERRGVCDSIKELLDLWARDVGDWECEPLYEAYITLTHKAKEWEKK